MVVMVMILYLDCPITYVNLHNPRGLLQHDRVAESFLRMNMLVAILMEPSAKLRTLLK